MRPAADQAGCEGLEHLPGDSGQAAGSGTPILDAERSKYVVDNVGLARYLARRFANRGEQYDDLVQVASLALVKAAARFDPTLGVAFPTFATTSMVGELRRHFRDHSRSIRVPRRLQSLGAEIAVTIDALSQTLGRSPTIREVALACERDESEVIEALEADRSGRPASLDEPAPRPDSASDDPLGARLASDDRSLSRVETLVGLSPHVSRLPREEQEVLHLRFVEDLTQSEIAKRIGISQMGVSRLLARALASLRASFAVEGD